MDYEKAKHAIKRICLQAKGDLPGAEATYRKVILLDPENFVAHANLGVILDAKGDLPGSLASFRCAVRFGPTEPKARAYYGLALFVKGELVDAEAELREALRLQPGFAFVQSHLDALFQARQRRSKALSQKWRIS